MATTETVVEAETNGQGAEAWWDRVLGHIEGLESTQVPPWVPMLTGMVVGVMAGVLLLLASL